jgi:PAS domain-containing protein
VDRFNDMLHGIQMRDNDIRKALLDREEALRDAEKARERFRFMAESMPQKIFTATPEGDVDYFNLQWKEFVQLPLVNAGWIQFLHPDDLDPNLRGWRHSIETGEPFHFQHRLRRADSVYRWHLTRAHAMRDADGNSAQC